MENLKVSLSVPGSRGLRENVSGFLIVEADLDSGIRRRSLALLGPFRLDRHPIFYDWMIQIHAVQPELPSHPATWLDGLQAVACCRPASGTVPRYLAGLN